MLLVSVYVKYDNWARMGNRIFQYCFGYTLAKKLNKELLTPGLPNFGIPSNVKKYPDIALHTNKFGNHNIDYTAIESTKHDIIVDSYLQKAEYYLPFRDDIKQHFKVKTASINSDALVVHIRETDYVEIKAFLGYDFYKKLINESGFNNVIIVTDNSYCDTVKRLVADGCVLNTEGYVDKFTHHCDDRGIRDFLTLLNSENIAISQSSFSWWAAFLGNHKKIIMPFLKQGGLWPLSPGVDDPNLILPECIKFVYD